MAAAALAVGSSPGGSSVMPSTMALLLACAKAVWGSASGRLPSAAVVRRVRRFNMAGLRDIGIKVETGTYIIRCVAGSVVPRGAPPPAGPGYRDARHGRRD